MTRPVLISVLAAFLGAVAFPVQGNIQGHFFFNASDKYRDWFHDPLRHHDTGSQMTHTGFRQVSSAQPIAEKYPYPVKAFAMTKRRWLKSANEAIRGNPDWFDVEVVRQRAEVEEYAPAMELLGWMYQEGRGLNKDLRKAYNMYERAKLVGKIKVRGNTEKIYDRLTTPEQIIANIVLDEDIQRIKRDEGLDIKGPKRVKLHVLKQQRELNSLRAKLRVAKKRSTSLLGFAK